MAGPGEPHFPKLKWLLSLHTQRTDPMCSSSTRKVLRPKKETPSAFSIGRRGYVQGEEGRAWPGAPPFYLIRPGDQTQQLQTQHLRPWPTHPAPSSGTFLFFHFSFMTGGEIPGRVVSRAQGFAETLGTSVNFEYTKGETLARSSAPSSPLKPKQVW